MQEAEGSPEEVQASAATAHRKRRTWIVIGVIALAVASVPCCGLIAALIVPSVVYRLTEAREAKARAEIVELATALEMSAIQNGGEYPRTLEELRQAGLDVPLVDPWNNAYFYAPPEGSGGFRVWSYGRDGVPGGEGPDRDFDNVMLRDGDVRER